MGRSLKLINRYAVIAYYARYFNENLRNPRSKIEQFRHAECDDYVGIIVAV